MAHIVSPDQKKHARALLSKIGAARMAGQKKRVKYWGCHYLNSPDAKLVAIHRAYEQLKPHRRPDKAELKTIAEVIDAWKGTNEEVRVRREQKSSNPNDYRVIMDFGIKNRALQYLVLGLLEKVFEPHPCQYLLRGGVQAAVYQLAKAMEEGPVCAYELDIKNCYQSFDGKKLASLIPLPKEVTEHVVIAEHLTLKGGTTTIYDLFGAAGGSEQDSAELMTALADAVRRGLPQGSAVSPIVAEMVLALSLNAVPVPGLKGLTQSIRFVRDATYRCGLSNIVLAAPAMSRYDRFSSAKFAVQMLCYRRRQRRFAKDSCCVSISSAIGPKRAFVVERSTSAW